MAFSSAIASRTGVGLPHGQATTVVTKSVSSQLAQPGDTLTYTLTISTSDTLTHTVAITDALPDGVTFVPGSLTGDFAAYDPINNQLTATVGLTPTISANYTYEDNFMVPDLINQSPLGKFVGASTITARNNNTSANYNPGCPFEFYSSTSGTANNLGFSTNGLVFPRGTSSGANSELYTSLPDSANPNRLLALFWGSMSITNTNGFTESGHAAFSVSAGCATNKIFVLHLQDLHTKTDSDPNRNALDVELVYAFSEPESYWVLYENVRGPLDQGVVGLENADGTLGVQYLKDGLPVAHQLTSGRVIHYYRPTLPAEPVVITFQVVVDQNAAGVVTNNALYTVDGSASVETASASFTNSLAPTSTLTSNWEIYLPLIRK